MGDLIKTKARRLATWPEALATEVEQSRDRPFKWGANDCCSFAVRVVAAMTGTTVESGGWSSAREACAALEERGGVKAALRATAAENGWSPCSSLSPSRGDVCAAFDGEGKTVFSICIGRALAVPGETGLQFLKLEHCLEAYSIPTN